MKAEEAHTACEVLADEFSSVEKELIQRVIHARRDIRQFRSAPIPADVLLRILEAAHAAPSVGFMQPWNFILVESRETRRKIKESFVTINAKEKSVLHGTARDELYSSLKLEGILEAPLNIAVTCDHSRNEPFVLGRAPMPQTAPYSVCLAIENLWLAARAEGVGVGWVSILDKPAVEEILCLPSGVELVAYLCVGYPVEFRSIPMLQEVGWKERAHLQKLIFHNQWGTPAELLSGRSRQDEPGLSPEQLGSISARAWDKINRKTKPPGSLGMLETIAVRLAELQQTLEPKLRRKRICVYAGCHGVTMEGVSAYPSEVTKQMVLNFLSGGAAINVLARHGGIQIHVVDAGVAGDWPAELLRQPNFFPRGVRKGTRNFFQEPAMTAAECRQAIDIGREQVRLAVETGIEVMGIGEMGIGNTTSASALLVALLGFEAHQAVGRGTGISDAVLNRKVEVVAGAVRKHARQAGLPFGQYWLETVGGYEIAAMTGTILEAAEVRMPLVVDGFIATAAAAAAFDIDPRCREVCFFSHRSDEQAHGKTLKALQVEPILDLKMRLGEGTGAALAMHLLDASAKILCTMATFDSAGISGAIDGQAE
ncbi:MAG: nicotinate-nucleotide--dimethylbenzimidazole phosphoribosyltransferase [Acidobacteriaceae bacterium]|nr:nicotinate-nucleotide--dimethylbenzimidazole phosphoribosyltransferase [Acidobacteriaceae bacterium]